MDSLLRRRELVTMVLLVAVAVRLLLLLVAVLLDNGYAGGVLLGVAAVAAAIWCTRGPVTPHARTLLLIAIIATAVSTLVEVLIIGFYAVAGPRYGVSYLFSFLPDLVLPVLAVILGLAVLQHPIAPTPALGLPPAVPLPVPIEQQPTWQPDLAAGAAWTTAGDAASGAPAAGWGSVDPQTPGTGWQPIPGSRTDPPDWHRPQG